MLMLKINVIPNVVIKISKHKTKSLPSNNLNKCLVGFLQKINQRQHFGHLGKVTTTLHLHPFCMQNSLRLQRLFEQKECFAGQSLSSPHLTLRDSSHNLSLAACLRLIFELSKERLSSLRSFDVLKFITLDSKEITFFCNWPWGPIKCD
uniref:Uncharacterized protein n=1 Tax=Glossina brevipalpis TaxID=37001 RepID=A0A1A9WJ49_9MUSC